MNNDVDGQEIFRVARFLFDLSKHYRVPEQFTDGAFYLTFFEPTFMPEVRQIRQRFWHTHKPPLASEPNETHWPFRHSTSHAPYRAPNWTQEQHQLFLNQVDNLEKSYGLPRSGAQTILYGLPPLFPFIKYIEETNLFNETESHLELQIFSARATGKHVATVYKKETSSDRLHVPGFSQKRTTSDENIELKFKRADKPNLRCIVLRIIPPWPYASVIARTFDTELRAKKQWSKELYCGQASKPGSTWGKQPAKQGVPGQIRTFAIFTLEKKVGMSIREAMRKFHHEFPDEGYSQFDGERNDTQYAEIRYQKERNLLLKRLPSLKSWISSSPIKR